MSRIALTDHAVDRFRERVCPDLSRGEAELKLRQLVDGAVIRRDRVPFGRSQCEAWMNLALGVALSLRSVRGCWVGTTIITARGLRVRIGR